MLGLRWIGGRPDVQPRAHSVAFGTRRRDGDRRGQRDPADSRQRVGDHLPLDLELARIGNVRIQATTAERIGDRIAAVGRWVGDGDDPREHDAFARSFDTRDDGLAGDRARHEDDLSVVARDHPAARGRLVDSQPELVANRETHGCIVQNAATKTRKHES